MYYRLTSPIPSYPFLLLLLIIIVIIIVILMIIILTLFADVNMLLLKRRLYILL